jgi:acetylornithine deacetylase/succinyl-diaminopimelate desuccinylase-like protein
MDADLFLRAFMPRACAENDEEVKTIPDAENQVPNDYFKPFRVEPPAVLVSGEADAAGSNGRCGKEVASFMPNAVHVMVPGAGHDAQDIARIAPIGMIFVPSIGGISHSPKEFTTASDMANGASVLLQSVLRMDEKGRSPSVDSKLRRRKALPTNGLP